MKKITRMFDWLKPVTQIEIAEQQIEQAEIHLQTLASNAAFHRRLAETYQTGFDRLHRESSVLGMSSRAGREYLLHTLQSGG